MITGRFVSDVTSDLIRLPGIRQQQHKLALRGLSLLARWWSSERQGVGSYTQSNVFTVSNSLQNINQQLQSYQFYEVIYFVEKSLAIRV
jgi:hypothetical protein